MNTLPLDQERETASKQEVADLADLAEKIFLATHTLADEADMPKLAEMSFRTAKIFRDYQRNTAWKDISEMNEPGSVYPILQSLK